MLSLSECRKILGKKFEHCTDQQIKQIRNWLYQIVGLETKGNTKNQNNSEDETSSNIHTRKHGRAS